MRKSGFPFACLLAAIALGMSGCGSSTIQTVVPQGTAQQSAGRAPASPGEHSCNQNQSGEQQTPDCGTSMQTRPLLYAGNSGDNSITVYDASASGNVSPLRRIGGTATRLNQPLSLAVDSQGTVWTLNGGTNPLTVTAYGREANGNAAPMRSYTLAHTETFLQAFPGTGIGQGVGLTLTPDGSGIVVAAVSVTPGLDPQDTIATYSTSSGALQRSFVPNRLNYCSSACFPQGFPSAKGLFRGIGFNDAGKIIAGYYINFGFNLSNIVSTFDAASAGSSPTVATPGLSFNFLPVTGNEFGTFTYGAREYAWARGLPSPLVPEVLVFQDSDVGALKQRIAGSNTLLDSNETGISIAPDHTVYVASSSGFVNVYGAQQDGNVAPIRRLAGTLTGLNGTTALAFFKGDSQVNRTRARTTR